MSFMFFRIKENMVHFLRFIYQVIPFSFSFLSKSKKDWVFVGDNADWSINHDGRRTLTALKQSKLDVGFSNHPFWVRGKIVHIGSLHSYNPKLSHLLCSYDHLVITCFHGTFGIHPSMDKKLHDIINNKDHISCLVVSNSTMRDRFLKWGFPDAKIRLIPVGVDTKLFTPVDTCEKILIRKRLNLPENHFIIGSFQKDGNGWEEGLEPKLIKGPDVFCDTISEVSKVLPIHVLLTGPARGYVKQRLSTCGITYTHHCLNSPDDIAEYYRALDCYIMCSREEGGPKSIPESLATAIPYVATRTGIVPDIENNFKYGWYCDVDDINCLIASTIDALTNTKKRLEFINLAPMYSSRFSWENIGNAYLKIYRELTQ